MYSVHEQILREYDEQVADYLTLQDIVKAELEKMLETNQVHVFPPSFRIKTRDSLKGKLLRKPEKYSHLTDLTDILGFRIICYFPDQVDECARLIERLFVIDYENSVDKRKLLDPTSFGYLSLHYICSLKPDIAWPEELTHLRFEIQLRTVLQHTWAEIEHDLGYKTEIGIPVSLRREFSRAAALLEVADNMFSSLKEYISSYTAGVRERVASDTAADIPLDLITLSEYISHAEAMRVLLAEMTALSGASVREVSPENYLLRLQFLGVRTLGDLTELLNREHDHALLLSREVLSDPEIDEVVSTVGLHYICRASLIFGPYDENALMNYFRLGGAQESNARNRAQQILRRRAGLSLDQTR